MILGVVISKKQIGHSLVVQSGSICYITDANGNTIYQSASNVDNYSLELDLNIPLTDFPYTLTYDEDGIIGGIGSSDDNLGNFTLDGSQSGTFTLSNSGTTITVNVMMSLQAVLM